jgi:multidrug efflux pump subunit AcrA (membrane-fusion protein)
VTAFRCRLVLLAGLIAASSACGGHSAGAQTQDARPAVPTAAARYGTYVETVSAVGRIGAPAGAATKLSFAEPGVLHSIDVRIGDRVSSGQALAQLDVSGLALSAQQAQADAAAAAANVQQSRVDRTSTKIAVDEAALRRAQSLYSAGVAPLKDVEAARAQLAQDRADASTAAATVQGSSAQLDSARARAALAARDLANGTLRSPIAGVVAAIYKREGEAVDTTTPVVSIAPEGQNSVTLDVTATDAARIHPGDPVQFTVTGTALRASGHVTGVSSALDPATQSATVVVTGVPAGAPAGSAVQAQISISHDRGIIIPQSAIVQDPQSGDTLVFVQKRRKDGNMTFEQRTVQVAHQNGTDALIASGLNRGELVAAQGAFNLLAPAGGSD